MPTANGTLFEELLSTPLVLPASVAGALAALFFVMVVVVVRRASRGGDPRALTGLFGAAIVTVGVVVVVVAVLNRLGINERAAEQRALLQRNLELGISATSAGSALACLDGLAGEETENACEKAVFADAQSTARAVAYVAARLSLLADVTRTAKAGGPDLQAELATTRRAIELDRYGIAAHVLAARDGCTADRCAAFALLRDAATLKANLKVHAFDTYVARYAAGWGKAEPLAERQPATGSVETPVASGAEPLSPAHPLDSRFDFPSSASIPPVSIMNAEPPGKPAGSATAAAPPAEKPAATAPAPPKRPQAQAAPPGAR